MTSPPRESPPDSVTNADRLTVRHVFADAYREIIALDSPALRTCRELTLRPGRFVREYIQGDRTDRITPVKYALLMVTLALILNQLRRAFFPTEMPANWDAEFANALYAAQDLFTYVLLLVLIPVSLLQRFLFRHAACNFAETYAFNAYIHGHTFWISIVSTLTPQALSIPKFVGSSITTTYVVWAICTFYQSYRASVIVRGLVTYFAGYATTMIVMQKAINWFLAR